MAEHLLWWCTKRLEISRLILPWWSFWCYKSLLETSKRALAICVFVFPGCMLLFFWFDVNRSSDSKYLRHVQFIFLHCLVVFPISDTASKPGTAWIPFFLYNTVVWNQFCGSWSRRGLHSMLHVCICRSQLESIQDEPLMIFCWTTSQWYVCFYLWCSNKNLLHVKRNKFY